ncbi:MAG: hypothetical protein EXX96DRAFT_549974 [Benjaminiella poitrasii]|nr:MAG: hypothetical protein EXX96DRAFT_549974 [Benjaminiella poitrasii]
MSKQDLKWVIQNLLSQKSHVSETKVVRRACVAAIIRWRPHLEALPSNLSSRPLATNATEFLNQPWINDCHGQAEMLFIERAVREGDNWSGQIAFPGGKNEASDKTDLDTVVRECKEEIGVHLDTRDFIPLGILEHRNIKSLTTNTITMILIPFVFLQVAPVTPKLTIQVSEVSGTHCNVFHFIKSLHNILICKQRDTYSLSLE